MEDITVIAGKFLLNFGCLETAVFQAIMRIFTTHNVCTSKTYYEDLQVLIKRNSFSTNLDYLKFYVSKYAKNKNDWNSLFEDITLLSEKRNILAHQIYGINFVGEKKMLKQKRYRALSKCDQEISISLTEMNEWCSLLNERYRQLFDSVIEAYYDENITWISKYPQLFY